ncbi:NlpC/P60 family protein [Catenuloplanes japonicus]|uniref:NlpC/P60 family protein n=1 Tax=Catenuloplanes japonicus TaxID=33876 RepID=UPI000A577AB9|nr:NlpC/P60 family protein [Catenuloplanes japonicus]
MTLRRLWSVAGAALLGLTLGLTALPPSAAHAGTCAPIGSGGSAAARRAIEAACGFVGQHYAWAGGHDGLPGPSQGEVDESDPIDSAHDPEYWSFDCSGLVRYAWYAATGVDLLGPGTVEDHYLTQSRKTTNQVFSAAQGTTPLQPGDILYYADLGHTTIYLGGGKMVEARESGDFVKVSDWRADRYYGAIRIGGTQPDPPYRHPGLGSSFKTWGSPAYRTTRTGGTATFTGTGHSVLVRVLCQADGQSVTAGGYTNHIWSYLPDYRLWVNNVFIQGPAVLPGVPACTQYPEIGGGYTPPGGGGNGCVDGSVPDGAGARSPRTATVLGRTIELRYSDATECAWGRITNGTIGDQVWTDRSTDNGATWTAKLGLTAITSGTDAFTTQWNDSGVVMRACGRPAGRTDEVCTSWF